MSPEEMDAWQRRLEDARDKQLADLAEAVQMVQSGNAKLGETMATVLARLEEHAEDIKDLRGGQSKVVWMLVTFSITVAASAIGLALQIAGHA